jgi:hypothetical protein
MGVRMADGDQTSFFYQRWGAPLFTAVLGLASGLALSSTNAIFARNTFFLNKQTETANLVATNFAGYVQNWNRMIVMSKGWQDGSKKPSEEEQKLFIEAVQNRNTFRDQLLASLDTSLLYFRNVEDEVEKFRKWDQQQATKPIKELPEIDEWRDRVHPILANMRRELLH